MACVGVAWSYGDMCIPVDFGRVPVSFFFSETL